jgi:hypothetical protein
MADNPLDSGNSADSRSSADGNRGSDESSSTDEGGSTDDGGSTDEGSLANDGSTADEENSADDAASDGNVSDATASDVSVRDATDSDGNVRDATVGDANVRDAMASDGRLADAMASDAKVIDAASDANDGATTGSTPPVDLGTAGNYVILTKTGISTVAPSVITGDLGASPVTATAITGFSLTIDSTNVFSTSAQVTGKVYAANYTAPTPSNLTTAIGDMQTALTDAAGRAPNFTELGAGQIGGMTLMPGVYKWGTGVLIPTDLTLTGNATDVWIFQIAQTLTVSNATKIMLTGGAVPKNVFWEVAGAVDWTSARLRTSKGSF